jgi:hypothetical protein
MKPQGLYDPRFGHDACGVGMICHGIKGVNGSGFSVLGSEEEKVPGSAFKVQRLKKTIHGRDCGWPNSEPQNVEVLGCYPLSF